MWKNSCLSSSVNAAIASCARWYSSRCSLRHRLQPRGKALFAASLLGLGCSTPRGQFFPLQSLILVFLAIASLWQRSQNHCAPPQLKRATEQQYMHFQSMYSAPWPFLQMLEPMLVYLIKHGRQIKSSRRVVSSMPISASQSMRPPK